MDSDVTIHERRLQVEEYAALRRAVGWPEVDPEAVRIGLARDLYTVVAERGGVTIGCGRIVGDGGIYFYLQDVIVQPQHQGQRIGEALMARLMAYLAAHARENSFIGLMAAAGVEAFYAKFGFTRRPDNRPGMYRVWHGS